MDRVGSGRVGAYKLDLGPTLVCDLFSVLSSTCSSVLHNFIHHKRGSRKEEADK